MKTIHLTVFGNPAQDLRLVEVSEPETPSAGMTENSFILKIAG